MSRVQVTLVLMLLLGLSRQAVSDAVISEDAYYLPPEQQYLLDDLKAAVESVAKTHKGCTKIGNASTSPTKSVAGGIVFFVSCRMADSMNVVGGYENVYIRRSDVAIARPLGSVKKSASGSSATVSTQMLRYGQDHLALLTTSTQYAEAARIVKGPLSRDQLLKHLALPVPVKSRFESSADFQARLLADKVNDFVFSVALHLDYDPESDHAVTNFVKIGYYSTTDRGYSSGQSDYGLQYRYQLREVEHVELLFSPLASWGFLKGEHSDSVVGSWREKMHTSPLPPRSGEYWARALRKIPLTRSAAKEIFDNLEARIVFKTGGLRNFYFRDKWETNPSPELPTSTEYITHYLVAEPIAFFLVEKNSNKIVFGQDLTGKGSTAMKLRSMEQSISERSPMSDRLQYAHLASCRVGWIGLKQIASGERSLKEVVENSVNMQQAIAYKLGEPKFSRRQAQKVARSYRTLYKNADKSAHALNVSDLEEDAILEECEKQEL